MKDSSVRRSRAARTSWFYTSKTVTVVGSGLSYLRSVLRIGRSHVNWHTVTLITTAAGVFYLVLGPLLITLLATFRQRGTLPFEPGPLTLENYAKVFFDISTWHLMANTLMFASGALILGVALALALGWLVERTDIAYRELLFSMIIAPMAIPGMMVAIGWIFLLDARIGLFNIMIRALFGLDLTEGPLNIYSLGGMIVVEGIRMVPTIFLMTSGAFRSMDPVLEEASRASGASTLATTFNITLPVLAPAIFASMVYFLIVAMEAFEVPGLLGMNAGIHVFSTRIYWAIHHPSGGLPDYGLASALGLILVMMSFFLILAYRRLTRHSYRFATVTGKGFRPQRFELGRWKYAAFLFCIFYFCISLVFPLFILIWTSLHKFYLPPSWAAVASMSLDSYANLFRVTGVGNAVVNTFLLALLTATATMVISLLVAWFVVRRPSGLTKTLDVVSFLPHAVPSIVVALAVMLMYLSFRNPFYGTIVIISIALTTRYLAFGSRTMAAGFLQIHPELEEASEVAGADWFSTCRRVILPLAAPVFINGWIWVGLHAARELTAALMLFTPSSVLISTSVWNMWEQGKASTASAFSVLLISILLIFNWLGRSVLGKLRAF
jgi:iron(III) transport system permease protein